jgi:hypothetical protein
MKEQEALLDKTVTVIQSQDGNYLVFSPSIEDESDKEGLKEQDNLYDPFDVMW